MYYIYEKSSTYIMGKPHKRTGVIRPDHRNSYKTMAAAKAALTRICKAEDFLPTDQHYALYRYGIAEAAYFHKHVEKQVRKTNMMTGKEYVESVNTPVYMSPACESYWSM